MTGNTVSDECWLGSVFTGGTHKAYTNNILPTHMMNFIAELHGISLSTELHLWWSLALFLFQSSSHFIVLEEKNSCL